MLNFCTDAFVLLMLTGQLLFVLIENPADIESGCI